MQLEPLGQARPSAPQLLLVTRLTQAPLEQAAKGLGAQQMPPQGGWAVPKQTHVLPLQNCPDGQQAAGEPHGIWRFAH
jgi:hypothetical protein